MEFGDFQKVNLHLTTRHYFYVGWAGKEIKFNAVKYKKSERQSRLMNSIRLRVEVNLPELILATNNKN